MDKQTFLLFGGVIIASYGLGYIFSSKLARTFFYFRGIAPQWLMDLWVRSLLSIMPEKNWILLYRFGLGSALLIVGLMLVAASFKNSL